MRFTRVIMLKRRRILGRTSELFFVAVGLLLGMTSPRMIANHLALHRLCYLARLCFPLLLCVTISLTNNREDEAAFIQELQEGISKGTSWERVTDIIELVNSRKCSIRTMWPSNTSVYSHLAMTDRPASFAFLNTRESLSTIRIQNYSSFCTWRVGFAADEGTTAVPPTRRRQGPCCRWLLRAGGP